MRLPGPAHLLNCYLWVGDDGVTLIDTGWPDSAESILAALRALRFGREDVMRVILTHYHEDHCGSAAQIATWSTVEVVAGAMDTPFIQGDEPGPLPVLTPAERTLRPDITVPPHGPPCRVHRTVRDGDILAFAGGTRVIDVPGHTPGSIALYLPAVDAVLTGDAVAEFHGQVILGVFNVDRPAAAESMRRLAATGAQVAGFGHGEAVLSGGADRIAAAVDLFPPDAV